MPQELNPKAFHSQLAVASALGDPVPQPPETAMVCTKKKQTFKNKYK